MATRRAAIMIRLPAGPSVPDSLLGLRVEELHALDVDRKAARLPRLHLRAGIHPRHAGPPRRELLLLLRNPLGRYPLGVNGEMHEKFVAESLDQIDITLDDRAILRAGGEQVLRAQSDDDLPPAVGRQGRAGQRDLIGHGDLLSAEAQRPGTLTDDGLVE